MKKKFPLISHNFFPKQQKLKTKKLMTKEEEMYREERQLRAIVECNLLTTDCVTTGTLREFCKREGF